jgi:hypothetical protein
MAVQLANLRFRLVLIGSISVLESDGDGAVHAAFVDMSTACSRHHFWGLSLKAVPWCSRLCSADKNASVASSLIRANPEALVVVCALSVTSQPRYADRVYESVSLDFMYFHIQCHRLAADVHLEVVVEHINDERQTR